MKSKAETFYKRKFFRERNKSRFRGLRGVNVRAQISYNGRNVNLLVGYAEVFSQVHGVIDVFRARVTLWQYQAHNLVLA